MCRNLILVLVMVALECTTGQAQEWARKMFQVTSHDFGIVARGAKAEYAFELENLYLEDIHIVAVQSSCGCTSPEIQNATLKTYEKGAILAKFNTATFLGRRGATLTVTIDRPFFAQVQLRVTGYIREDVLVQPGSVQLGSMERSVAAERKVVVRHFGRNDWKILKAQVQDAHLSARVVETARGNGEVCYDLIVRLDDTAPEGYFRSQVILQTDENSAAQFPVAVEGWVQPAVTVSPSALFLGVVEPGQKVTRQLVLRAKEPFRIKAMRSDGNSLTFDTATKDELRQLHLVPVNFVAGKTAGRVNETIRIETTLNSKELVVFVSAVVADSVTR
jgi:hypothetical protein